MPTFTEAEQGVIDALRAKPNATNAEIGEALGKTEKTVKLQLGSIYDKLGFNNYHKRIDLVLWAKDQG